MVSLNVNLKLNPTQRKFIRLENISTDMLVSDLKQEIISKAGFENKPTIEILHGCKILKDTTTLKLLEGSSAYKMIHAVCVEPVTPPELQKLTTIQQQQLVVSFRAAMTNPHFKQFLQEVSSVNSIKNLMSSVPGLSVDYTALSMLRDWELLLHIADPKCVQTLVERHPALADAATKITSSFQDSFPSSLDSQQRRRPNAGWFARSLGADADDDNMETEATPSGGAAGSSQPRSGGLTPAQLAAALAYVNQSLSAPSAINTPRPTTSTTVQSPPNQPLPSALNTILTPEMLNHALRQAMNSVSSSTVSNNENIRDNSTPTRPGRANREEAALREQFGRFLPQMRELGIADDLLSLRALQATNGDVQAAVNLVFAGLVDD